MPCRDWIPSILQVQMASCTLRFWSQMSTMESRSGKRQADWKTRRQAITFRKGSGYDSNGIQKLPKVLNDIREPYHIFRNKQKQGNKKTTTKKQRHQTKTPVFSILHPGLQHTFVKALGAEAFKPDVCLLSGSWWLFWQRNNSQMCTRYPFLPYSWFSEKWVQPTVVSFYLGYVSTSMSMGERVNPWANQSMGPHHCLHSYSGGKWNKPQSLMASQYHHGFAGGLTI